MRTKPKLFLAPVDTLRGNRAHEWRGTTARLARERCVPAPRPQADKRAFWLWLVNLTREAARTGSPFRPGGRASW